MAITDAAVCCKHFRDSNEMHDHDHERFVFQNSDTGEAKTFFVLVNVLLILSSNLHEKPEALDYFSVIIASAVLSQYMTG